MAAPFKKIISVLSKFEGRYSRAVLAIFLTLFGSRLVSLYFSYSPLLRRTEARALWLQKRIGGRHGRDAGLAMAVRYLTARPKPQHYRPLLCQTGEFRPTPEEMAALLPGLIKAIGQRPGAATALVAALLERGEAHNAVQVIIENTRMLAAHDQEATKWPTQFRSLCLRPLNAVQFPPVGAIGREDLIPAPAHHRLLVMDEDLPPGMICHLAHGVGRLTVLRFNDLLGQIKLDPLRAALPGVEVTVEHARTRIGRFSAQYHALHQRTLSLAEELVRPTVAGMEGFGSVDEDTRLALVLGVADRLFFKALRMDGCLRAMKDSTFDSVIISAGRSLDLIQLAFSDGALVDDERVAIGCWSADVRVRSAWHKNLAIGRARAAAGMKSYANLGTVKPADRTAIMERVATFLSGEHSKQVLNYGDTRVARRKIALITNGNRAYTTSAIQIAFHLQRNYNVDVVWAHGKIDLLNDTLRRVEKELSTTAVGKVLHPGYVALNIDPTDKAAEKAFDGVFRADVASNFESIDAIIDNDAALRTALATEVASGMSQFVLRSLAQLRRAENLLSREHYDAVLICPVREPRNALFVAGARHCKIPSITVEPHCLNATYCRYSAVLTDYATLYSDYFINEYAANFGIPGDRSYPVGSPRLLQPVDYDSELARQHTRQKLGIDPETPVVAMTTQPMPVAHTEEVFRFVVRAIASLRQPVKLYIKPHPEENESNIALYKSIIRSEGCEESCQIVSYDIKELIMASNLVVTYYSVTALEAAILERNVVIAGRQGEDYPMPYHEIISVPCCRSEEELRAALIDTFDRGDEAATSISGFKRAHPYLYDNGTFDRLSDAVGDVIARGRESIRDVNALPAHPFVSAPFREFLDQS